MRATIPFVVHGRAVRAVVLVLSLAAQSCGPSVGQPGGADQGGSQGTLGDGLSGGMDASNGDTPAATLDATDSGVDSTGTEAPRTIARVVAGIGNTCVIFDTGALRCWGARGFYRLGRDSAEDIGDDEPASAADDIVLPTAVVDVAIGQDGMCAILDDGSLTCWGDNNFGTLGYPNNRFVGDDEPLGAAVELDGTVTHVSMDYVTCVALDDGRVRCWGPNLFPGVIGQGVPACACGDMRGQYCCLGEEEPPLAAPAVALPGSALMVTTQLDHVCTVMTNGEVRCWGNSLLVNGIPGVDVVGDNELPSDVPPLDTGANAVSLGLGANHVCILSEQEGVRCWGLADDGQLGSGSAETIGDDEPPSAAPWVPLPGAVKHVGCGMLYSCALLVDGSVWCWGNNEWGTVGHPGIDRLGDNEPADSLGPVAVGGRATQLSVGPGHVCALLERGALRCWGGGNVGALGYGNTEIVGDNEEPAAAGDVPVE